MGPQHRHDDLASLQDMVRRFYALDLTFRPAIVARVLAEGLMVPRGWQAKWVSFIIWVRMKLRRQDKYTATAECMLHPAFSDVLHDTFDQTMDWIISGTDQSDIRSVGGFNQGEVNSLSLLLQICEGKVGNG